MKETPNWSTDHLCLLDNLNFVVVGSQNHRHRWSSDHTCISSPAGAVATVTRHRKAHERYVHLISDTDDHNEDDNDVLLFSNADCSHKSCKQAISSLINWDIDEIRKQVVHPSDNWRGYARFLVSEITVVTDEPHSDLHLRLSSRDTGNDYTHDAEKGLRVVKSLNVLPWRRVQLGWMWTRGVGGGGGVNISVTSAL